MKQNDVGSQKAYRTLQLILTFPLDAEQNKESAKKKITMPYESSSAYEVEYYRRLLLSRPAILGGNTRYTDYLEEHRIELNTVLAIVKPQAFWKMLEVWP